MKLNNTIKYRSLAFIMKNITLMSQECPDSHLSSHVYSVTYVYWMGGILLLTFTYMCHNISVIKMHVCCRFTAVLYFINIKTIYTGQVGCIWNIPSNLE